MTEETPASEWFRLKQERGQSRGPDDYERWAIWYFADRGRRAIAPDASITVAGFIQERVRSACHLLPDYPSWLEEALRYSSTNALCLARLAQVQARWNSTIGASTLAQLDWLTRRAMELAPDEPVVQWARALALARTRDTAGALQLMGRVRQAGFQETCFLVDYTDLLVKARRLPEAYAVFEAALMWEPESESQLEAHMRKSYRADWAGKLARTQRDKNLRVFDFAVQGTPPRQADLSPQMLDLTPSYYNALAALWFHSGTRLDGLSNFVDSPVNLDGIAFDVRGYVLATDQSPQSAKSKGILVRRLCRRLHMLPTAWATWPPGTRLGSYQVYFADGDRREIPIVYGRNVGAFVNHPAATEEAATVAWEHQSTDGARLRLYRLTWDNPRPDMAIDHLEFIAERKTGEPALLAVTVEP